MKKRAAEVQRSGRQAEAAGRAAWNQATRTGQPLSAQRPRDVVVVGVRVMQQKAAKPGAHPAAEPLTQDIIGNLAAGARGARASLPFGAGELSYAGALALAEAAHGANLGHAFANHIAAEKEQDRYDAAHYPLARRTGQVLGIGAQIAALGPAEGLLAGGVRMAEATPLIAREIGYLAGGGGAVGIGGQAVADVLRRHVGSPGDYAGAALGGAVGGLASLGGRAGYAGAVGGAATSVAQDLFNGHRPSLAKAGDAAVVGGLLGTAGGLVGRGWSDRLHWSKQKGPLGENFSRVRTWARGDETQPGPKRMERLPGGGRTIPDHRTFRGQQPREIVESKFGRKNELSKGQKQAYKKLSNYRVDHTMPSDVGAMAGFPLAVAGDQLVLSIERPKISHPAPTRRVISRLQPVGRN